MAGTCCVTGSLHEGTPKGEEVMIGGLHTYVAKASSPSDRCIIILHDAFGWKLVNTRLLADEYAQRTGLNCFLPDLFEEEALHPDVLRFMDGTGKQDPCSRVADFFRLIGAMPSALMFLNRHKYPVPLPRIQRFCQGIRQAPWGIQKWGAIGYCWGGRFSILMAGDAVPADCRAACIAAAHPSFVEVPGDIEKIAAPALFLCAETDQVFQEKHRRQAEEILRKKEGARAEFVVYPGTQHGFAVRGNFKVPAIKEGHEKALEKSAAFFKEHLGK